MQPRLLAGIIILILLTTSVSALNLEHTQTSTLGGNHDPIYINGNTDFTPENGVTGGNGTITNPYIIADWIIEDFGLFSSGIRISNTSVHFIIQNCKINNFFQPGQFKYGIYLNNVINGSIKHTILNNNHKGINIEFSQNLIIKNCSIFGISTDNAHGIQCYHSTNLTIKTTRCFDKKTGIKIAAGTSYLSIIDTELYDNEDFGILGYTSKDIIHHISITNCSIFNNNDEGIRFEVGAEEGLGTGQISISDCKIYFNGVTPPHITNSLSGIEFRHTINNLIENCSIHDNGMGVKFQDCRGSIIRNCTVYNHRQNKSWITPGIIFQGPGIRQGFNYKPNLIRNCDIYDNEIGLQLFTSILVIERNDIINNSVIGIAMAELCFPKIQYNNIFMNGANEIFGEGVYAIYFSFGNMIKNWWGSNNGPSGIGLGSGDSIEKKLSIIFYRPWLTEPVPDAGRQT